MIKVVAWVARKPGMSVEAFQRHWREEHPKVVLRLPGLRRYVQDHVQEVSYAKGDPPIDGVAETWWGSREQLVAHRGTPELAALLDDEERFIDLSRRNSMLVEEHPIRDKAVGHRSLKQITFVKRKAGMELAAFHDYWRTVHGPLALAVPGLRRYVQNHTQPDAYRAGSEPEFDGVTMVWFDDLAAMRASARSPELAAVLADGPAFLDPAKSVSVVVAERHVI